MKAFIIRVLSVLFLTSFCTMLLWHYFTQSNTGFLGPRTAKELQNSLADFDPQNAMNKNAAPRVRRIVKKIYIMKKSKNPAASNPRDVPQKSPASNNAADSYPSNVKLNPANRKGAAASNPRNVQQNPPASKDAADSNPRKAKRKPANINNAADSNPRKVNPNPANINNAAASNPRNVQQNPAANNNAAAGNPRDVKLNPGNSEDVAANNPRNVPQKPPANNNAVASNPRNVKPNPANSKDVAASNPRNVPQKPPANNNAVASNPRKIKPNPANRQDAAENNPNNVQQKPPASNNAAASIQRKVKLNPAKSNNAAASNPHNVQPNPQNMNNAADSDPNNVKLNPANNINAAASNPRNVKQNPADINNAAANEPRNIQQNPAAENNAADSNPRNVEENPVNSNNAVDTNVQENPVNSNNEAPRVRRIVKKIYKTVRKNEAANNPQNVQESINEDEVLNLLLANYTRKWKKNERNSQVFRSFLSSTCSAITNATVTQDNSPVGTKFTYDGDNKRSMEVTPQLFKVFPKKNPFLKAPWDTCAVVGNGGILANSSCGKEIDSATFVIRCNLPPLNNGYEKDTGQKTSLVTANPSIFIEKYSALNEYRRPFLEDMQTYGDALVLLPAFSFRRNTAVCLRALYSLEDFSNNGPRPIIFNPTYLNSLAQFWREQGIHSLRLSTGIMMASLALELCNNVHLYGFWPFGTHPYTHQQLNNHYYDNRPVNKRMHIMPDEIKALMNLHNKGVIHLHLDNCAN